jgi:hypothetical protein
MPNWNDAEDIKRWLEANKDKGAKETQQKAADRQAQEKQAQQSQAPRILQPLVDGRPVQGPRPQEDAWGGWQGAEEESGTGRKRAKSQTHQRETYTRDDRTRIGDIPWNAGNRWGDQNAVPVAGFGMLPAAVAEKAKEDAILRAAREDKKETIDFGTWRQVSRQSFLPGLPRGDVFDLTGLGDTEAAKWADWQSYQQQNDKIPEQFPGQDAALNVLNQWGAATNLVTTTPVIPATPRDKELLGIPQEEDARFSLAEGATLVGQVLNRTLNPFNPNRKLGEFQKNEAEALATAKENYQFRTSIPNMAPAQQDVAWRVWTANSQSNTAAAVYDQIVNKGKQAAEAKAKMQAAQAAGDAEGAAKWGQEYDRLQKRTELDIITQNMNPWAEMLFGTFIDPVDWVTGGTMSVLGATPYLAKTAATARKFNIDLGTATRNIDRALAEAAPVIAKITEGKGLETPLQRVNIFARSAPAKAYIDARELYETAMVLTTGVTSKIDAKNVIADWVETGGKNLVQGMGVQTPLKGMLGGSDNVLQVGAGVLGNTDILKRYPILGAAKDQLLNMKALNGEGVYKPTEFLVEFAKIVEDTAKKAYKVTGKESKFMTAISTPSRVLRAILSTMYLNLAPRNWVRQGTSQAANLMADDTFSLRPLKSILADLAAKNEGLPMDMRLAESDKLFGEVTSQPKTLAEMFGLSKTNPLAKLEHWGAEQWGGMTTIGGVLPRGENAFYANAYGTTFQRTFKEFWRDAVSQQYYPELIQAGFEAPLAKAIADKVIEAGITGGKVDVATALRKIAAEKTLRAVVPVPDESMLLEYQKELGDILNKYSPDQMVEAKKVLDDFFLRAKQQAANVLAQAPPVITPSMTAQGTVEDAKHILANAIDILQRRGAPKEAIDEAQQIVAGVLEKEADVYGQFMRDLAQAADPQALNFAFDVWGRAFNLKTKYRQIVDAANKDAMKAIDAGGDRTQAWTGAYEKVTGAWSQYGQEFGDMMGRARADLLNGNTQSVFDWHAVIDQYKQYNTDVIEEARRLVPMGTRENAAVYDQVIDANRQFVDHAYAELFSVFKAFPTVDSFDIIGATFRHADAIGAQASVAVRKAAEEAKGSLDWNKYYEYASATWREASESSVEAIQAAKRAIVWNHVVEQTPSKLAWVDDFAGDFQLLGPSERPGIWYVKQADGRTVTLAEEGHVAPKVKPMGVADADATITKEGKRIRQETKAKDVYESGGSGIYVPTNIVADYNRIVNGNVEDTVDELLEAVPGGITEAPKPLTPRVNEIAPEVPQTPPPGEIASSVASDMREMPQGDLVRPRTGTEESLVGTGATTPPQTLVARPTGTGVSAPAIRKAAAITGIGTDKGDRQIINSINKHIQEMGLEAVKIKKLADLGAEDAQKVVAYYTQRAADMGRNAWDNAYTAADEARMNLEYVQDGMKQIEEMIRNASDQRAVTSATTKQMGGKNRPKDWIAWYRKQQYADDKTWVREFEEKLQEFSPNATLGGLLNQYDNLLAKVPGLQATIKESESFIKRRGGKVIPQRIDEIVAGLGDEVLGAMGVSAEDLKTMDRRTLLRMYESYLGKEGPDWEDLGTAQPSYFAGGLGIVPGNWPNWMVPRPLRKEMWKRPTGTGRFFADDDAYKSLQQGILAARAGNATPQVGDMALEQLRTIDQIREYVMTNLPNILAGTPNTLTPAQQLQVIDLAARHLMPAWDNVIRAAAESGKKMGNFAMMDFNDRRDIDTLLSLVMPFHYYWSRSAGNWTQRVMAKPQWLDFWLESQEAVRTENAKPELVDGQWIEKPARLQGTVPNPLAQLPGTEGWMPQRIQSPTTWGLPFEMYLGYQRADELDTPSQVAKVQAQVAEYFAAKTFPWYQSAAAKMLDNIWPLEDGKKRLDDFLLWEETNTQQLGDFIPIQRMVGYGAQALGMAGQPSGKPWSYGDEWDPYLVGRQIRNATQQGQVGPLTETAQYAQQMVENVQSGKSLEEGIPPDQVDAARKIYEEAVKAEGGEKFGRTAGGWLTGFTSQYYPQAEKEYQAGAQRYYESGYGPENLGGSKAARDINLEATPALEVQWGQKGLVPGAEGIMPPAVDAQISQLYTKAEELTAKRDAEATAAGEAAAKAGGDVYDARDPVYKKFADAIDAVYSQIETLRAKYPTTEGAAPTPPGEGYQPKAVRTAEEVTAGTYPQGRNPAEYKDLQVTDVYKEASAKFPYNDNAPGAEKHATAVAKEKFVVDGLVALGYTAAEAKAMYAENKVRDLSAIEKAAVERNRQAAEDRDAANDALWAQRGAWVTEAFGAEAFKTWDSYFDLPKGSQARKDYRAAHPELNAFDLAAYQPDGFQYLTGKYGADGVMEWAKTPKWAEDAAAKAIRTAYLDAHPRAWMVGAWVNGRPQPFDQDAAPERNYGKDYQEAEKLFGADIWDKVLEYRTAGKDARKGLFKGLGLADWSDWWYGLLPELERRTTLPAYAFRGGGGRAFGGGGGGYGGGGGGGYGGGGGGYVPRVDVYGMDRDLVVRSQDIQAWRPPNTNTDWMYAGNPLKPQRTNWWK